MVQSKSVNSLSILAEEQNNEIDAENDNDNNTNIIKHPPEIDILPTSKSMNLNKNSEMKYNYQHNNSEIHYKFVESTLCSDDENDSSYSDLVDNI
jgi:hypothetical protein